MRNFIINDVFRVPLRYWDDNDGGEISDGCQDNSDTDGELTPDDDTPVSDDSFYLPSDHDRPHKNFPQQKSPEKGIESSLPIKPLPAKKVKTPKVPFKYPLTFRAHTAQPTLHQKKIPQFETNLFMVSKKALGCRNSPNSFPRPFESEGKPLVRNNSKGEAPKLRKKNSI